MHSSKLKLFFISLLFLPVVIFAQTITGKITNAQGEKIITANVIIRDSVGAEDTREFVIARNGEYKIVLQGTYQRLVVEVTAHGYTKEYVELGNLQKEATYVRNFVLQKDNEQIEEVVIKAKKNPFSVNEDTTKFDVKGYSDGTERKIEEVIKKLPGVQVNEKTGEIKYKNKSIETIKLDGDDLFGANYTIGSRNINVNMVEQIQAIENYSENPLLKGIENSDKVILNLKLKKGIDFSGDMTLGQGVMAGKRFARDVGSTLLAVTKNYKAFGSLSYNNIGINRTPFNYFNTLNYNPEELKERNFFATKLLPEYGFSSVLEEKRVNINQTLFGSYNQVFKIGKRANVKSGLYYTSDNIQAMQYTLNTIRLATENIETSDVNQINKRPTLYNGDAQVKINTSASSLTEYKLKLKSESIFTPTDLLQNNVSRFKTEQYSNNFYWKQSVLFTKKISDSKAMQISLDQASNLISQKLVLEPAVLEASTHIKEQQIAKTARNTFETKAILLGRSKKGRKYTVSLGAIAENSPIMSSFEGFLDNGTVSTLEDFRNNFTYRKNRAFNEATYFFNVKKWKLSLLHAVSLLQQSINSPLQEQNRSNTSLFFEPSVSFSRKLTDIASVNFSYGYNQMPFTEEYFFRNPIVGSVRQITKNIPDLQFSKSHSSNASYSINDLYNQFQFMVGTSYTASNGNYFSDLSIERNRTQMILFYSPQNTDRWSSYLSTEKFFYKALILLKFNADYGFQTYNNIVNGSELRRNQMQMLSSRFEVKTGFNTKINFQNQVEYRQTSSKSVGRGGFQNESLNNSFSTVYKMNKKDYLALSADIFIPNIQKKQEKYLFIDAHYNVRLGKIDVDLVCKNILNKNNFEQISTSDYAVTVFRTNLLPRYGMIKVSCNF
jgi:hypothetical protein